MAELLALNNHGEITSVSQPIAVLPITSIVVPVYRSPESLTELYERIATVFETLGKGFELLLVNDGCPKGSWSSIEGLANRDSRVVGINLSRNFSQHRAILAGLDHARGESIIVMDCDLQDPPEVIPLLFERYEKGYDKVIALRVNRKDSFIKKLGSKIFTRIFNYMTDTSLRENEINFSLISRRVLDAVCRLRDQNVFYLLSLHWVGFKLGYVQIEHAERKSGKSSYTLSALFNLAFSSILAHSNRPLKLMIVLGFILASLAFLYASWLTINYLLFGVPVEGWTSIMVTIFFFFGVLFANIGVVGLYVGRCFDETKNRPLYLVKDRLNTDRIFDP